MVNPGQRHSTWVALATTFVALAAIYFLLGWAIAHTAHSLADGVSIVDGISIVAIVLAVSALIRREP